MRSDIRVLVKECVSNCLEDPRRGFSMGCPGVEIARVMKGMHYIAAYEDDDGFVQYSRAKWHHDYVKDFGGTFATKVVSPNKWVTYNHYGDQKIHVHSSAEEAIEWALKESTKPRAESIAAAIKWNNITD